MTWQLDKRVSVGNIIAIALLLAAIFGAYNSLIYKTDMTTVVLESLVQRVEKVEDQSYQHELRWTAHDAREGIDAETD